MLRVLMIGPVPRVGGGISAVTGAILDSDLPRRCQLTYLAEGTRRGPAAKAARFGAAALRAGWLLLWRRVDILHLHVGGGSSLYRHLTYLALGRLARVPVVVHWHLPAPELQAASAPAARPVRWALDRAAAIVVLSSGWRPVLTAMTANRRIVVLPNPVDCAAIRPPADPAIRRPDTVLFLGDFTPRKGAADLLAAAPAVLAQHPGARFVLCGGEPSAALQALAAPLGEAAVFPGFVRGPAKWQQLQQAALFVLPSYAEGAPVALLEAMAAGLPVVVTPVGGVPDIVQAGRNGLVVTPGDRAALAAAISRLLADPAERQAMGARNRRQALAEFDLPTYADKLMALYTEVAQSIRRSPFTVHR